MIIEFLRKVSFEFIYTCYCDMIAAELKLSRFRSLT